MPYRQAITMIDDLPPIVQMAPKVPAIPLNRMGLDDPNKYYEEAIQKHPTVQSKIRPTESNPLAKYEETVEKDRRFEMEDNSQPMYPKYPIISRPRSVVEQNYVSSNMIPQEEEQHLPVSQNIPVRYNRPLIKTTPLNTYPIVEHLEPQLSCTDVANHIKNCPICKQLYIERVFVIMVIAVLIIIIIALIFKIRSSK